MTDNTQPEALRALAEAAAWTGKWYDAGCNTVHCTYGKEDSIEHDEIAHPVPLWVSAYIAAAHPQAVIALLDRIAELEAQLSSSGFTAADMATAEARGFRDGVAFVAASAGREPVAWRIDWPDEPELGHYLSEAPTDSGRCQPLYLHPSPPKGMVGGWMPIETAPKYTEHGVSQHLLLGYAPDEIHEDGFVSQGYWMEAEEDAPDNMGHDGGWVDVHFDFFRCGRSFGAEAYRSAGTQPTHWMPLPPRPTSSADSRKGE